MICQSGNFIEKGILRTKKVDTVKEVVKSVFDCWGAVTKCIEKKHIEKSHA